MIDGLNKVMIIGTVDGNIELRRTASGRPVVSFTVAVARSVAAPHNDNHSETEWFNVIAWGGLAERCQQVLAGSRRTYVEGRLQTRSWDDDMGTTHFRTEIVATDVIALD